MKRNEMGKDDSLVVRNGFSLVEVVVVIALMAVVAAFSAPTFIEWQQNLRYKQSAGEIGNALKTAKSKAITLNQQHGVRMTPADRSYRFARYSATTNEWVYYGAKEVLPDQVTLNLNGTAASAVAPTPNIRFNANGSTFNNYSIRVSGTNASKYTVSVERSGRIRVLKVK